MRTLTSDKVMQAAAITMKGIQVMCDADVVTPVVASIPGRHGTYRQFTVMQAVGICVVQKLRADRGLTLEGAGKVIRAFTDWPEAELIDQLKKGNSHYVMVHQGHPLLRPKQYDWPSVADAYLTVCKALLD